MSAVQRSPTALRKQGCDFPGPRHQLPDRPQGALKLKEISYIHAEGYPAGEMKHGPIALLDSHVPVVSIPGVVFGKVLSNPEAKARDAQLIGVAPDGPDTACLMSCCRCRT